MNLDSETSYRYTVVRLLELLALANAADSDQSHDWQLSRDASVDSVFGHLRHAAVALAGDRFFREWAEYNEIDWRLATRSESSVLQFLTALEGDVGCSQVELAEEWRAASEKVQANFCSWLEAGVWDPEIAEHLAKAGLEPADFRSRASHYAVSCDDGPESDDINACVRAVAQQLCEGLVSVPEFLRHPAA